MAAMGKGKLARGKGAKAKVKATPHPLAAPLLGGLNLVVPTSEFARVAECPVSLPTVGRPIMRDGFVTETGLMVRGM